MEQSKVSDFSIARILSSELGRHNPAGPRLAPDLRDVSRFGFCVDVTQVKSAVPVPVPACWQYFGQTFQPYGVGLQCTDASSGIDQNPNMRVCFWPDSADAFSGYHGFRPAGPAAGRLPRQKAQVRTVFTERQTKHLESLFSSNDYPPVEVRAQVAGRLGLSEETVRVWFKNRRAQRKRQCRSSKVKVPIALLPSAGTEKLLRTFL
ncbi:pituitary homeobox 3-like [Entelurus aequoreus]|uniref:pituitary homeobox 3-like n=1 Tax=Entelurus aequoreus TaxID=161455 RepID=UPI002B1D9E70|nr:pituitary homeobox 3-like [Entelurus aequoreus]